MRLGCRLIICLVFFIAVKAPGAGASCEGAQPSELLTAWYDPVSGTLIKEEGTREDNYRESRFIWFAPHKRVEMFEAFYIAGHADTIFSGDDVMGRSYADILDDPPVLEWNDNEGGVAPEAVRHLRKEAVRKHFVEEGAAMPEGHQRSERFERIVQSTRESVSKETGFPVLNEQAYCPYSVKNIQGHLIVFKKYTDAFTGPVNFLWSQIPNDDRSATRVTQTRCFGLEQETDFLVVRWDWECQGEGDVMLPLKNGKIGPRMDE